MTTAPQTLLSVLVVLVLAALGVAQIPSADADRRIARTYDLQALVELSVAAPAGAGAPPVAPVDSAALQRAALQSLATLVRTHVRPELAPNEEVLPLGEKWLAMVGRPEQHAWLDGFLQGPIAAQPVVGRLRVEVVTMTEIPFLRDVAPALARDDRPAAEVTVLQPGAATTEFLAKLRAHPEANALALQGNGDTLRGLVPCSVAAVRQTPYVRDFEVEIAQGQVIADPLVDVVQDGFMLQVTALPDNPVLGLALSATWSALRKPIPTFTTTLGVGQPVTIQLPEVRKVQLEAAVALPADHVVVLQLPALHGMRCIAVLRVEPFAADPPKERGR
jgi:hypothetical protein